MTSRLPLSFAVAIIITTGCGGTADVSVSCGGEAPDSSALNTYVEIDLDLTAAGSAGRITVELTRTDDRTEVEMRLKRRFGWKASTASCSGASREYRISLTGGRVSNGALRIATPSPARVVVRSEGSAIAERVYSLATSSPAPLEWP